MATTPLTCQPNIIGIAVSHCHVELLITQRCSDSGMPLSDLDVDMDEMFVDDDGAPPPDSLPQLTMRATLTDFISPMGPETKKVPTAPD